MGHCMFALFLFDFLPVKLIFNFHSNPSKTALRVFAITAITPDVQIPDLYPWVHAEASASNVRSIVDSVNFQTKRQK